MAEGSSLFIYFAEGSTFTKVLWNENDSRIIPPPPKGTN